MKTVTAEIMFGLVRIPVKVTGATNPSGETRLRTLHVKCLTPIQNKAWCPTCKKDADETVKGVKAGGKYVAVTDDQLETVKAERSNMVTITKFVLDDEIGYLSYSKHYHLIPDDKITDGYTLLVQALVKKKMVGVGSTCLWGKEHPVLVRPYGDGLLLTLLHVSEDMVSQPYVAPPFTGNKSMVALAVELVERQAGTLDPSDVTSESRAAREAMVDGILNTVETPTPTFDLLAALRLSVSGKGKVKT